MPRRLNCTFDLRLWRPGRTHRVQGNDAGHEVARLAGFLDVQNFAALIVAALGAGTMRHFALVAVRALGEGVTFVGVVSAPRACARFGVSPFWIWHLRFLC